MKQQLDCRACRGHPSTLLAGKALEVHGAWCEPWPKLAGFMLSPKRLRLALLAAALLAIYHESAICS